jgi:hypothetical protein
MVYWFFNTPSIGSGAAIAAAALVFFGYFKMLRWIQTAPPDPQSKEDTSTSEGEQ